MFWITKYRHNKIVDHYQKTIDDLREALWRKEKFEKITEKLVDITAKINPKAFNQDGSYSLTGDGGWITAGSIDVMASLDDSVPRYVEDYFGGRCIKQEAYPVTILDENGKATYALTATKPDKNKRFILEYKF